MVRTAAMAVLLSGLILGIHPAAKPVQKTNALEKWSFAGENYGVRIYFKIKRECQENGASLALKLENTKDYAVTVKFRIKDPDWSKTFERNLKAQGEDASLKFSPETGTVCHPYVDEMQVEELETKVSQLD